MGQELRLLCIKKVIVSHHGHQCDARLQSERPHLFLQCYPVTVNLNSVGIRLARRRGWPSICSRRPRSHFKSSTSAPIEREKFSPLSSSPAAIQGQPSPSQAVLCRGRDALPWGREPEQMHASVRQPLMPPGMWYVLNYHCCLLSEGERSVLSQHVSQINACLIHR